MLGVAGKPTRNDVQRPSSTSECGNVNIGKTIDSSTPVQAAPDGTFTVTAINFNAYVALYFKNDHSLLTSDPQWQRRLAPSYSEG